MKVKVKIIVGMWLLFATGAYAASALHHYTFDGSAVIDLVGAANGTLLNGASVSLGKLNLDGVNDYVQFSQHIIPTTGNFSVAFFAQELSPKTTWTEIISQGYSGGPGFYVGTDPSHNFRIGDNLTSTGVPFPSDGLVHHYAVTKGVDTRLYVDGSLIKTFGSIGMTTGGSDTRLGCQFSYHGEYFNGNIDDLYIFSGTLTAGEIAALAVIPEPATIAILALGMLFTAAKKK
ncbi:MAG: PEP-CTERM sorting domain-containing protein [Planctomycetaceae bacterium]|nr:PEP-CTERM sorting domain-containing protein [Planctomycetaceae bacterium]